MTTAQEHLDQRVDFATLTRNQRKVLIATDALALIATEKFTPMPGTYWSPNWNSDQVTTARDHVGPLDPLAASSEGCEVCALGACFVASFLRDGVCETEEPLAMSTSLVGVKLRATLSSCKQVSNRLARYFDPIEIGLMETAFEISPDYAYRASPIEVISEADPDGYKRARLERQGIIQPALEFGRRYANPKDRLEAILKNVIDNCGEFKP